MSIESMAIALHHSQASGSAKLVLLGIANHDGDGGAFPAVLTLAKYGNFTGWDAEPEGDTKEARDAANKLRESARRAARRAIRKLEELGEITTEQNAGAANRPEHERTNLYRFNITCPPDCDRSAQHRRLKNDPRTISPGEGTGARSPRTLTPHEPSFNQPIGNSVPRSGESHANDRDSDSPKDPYANLSQGEKQEQARRRMIADRTAETPTRSRYTVPAAPRVPRFDPASLPQPPEIVPWSAAEAAAAERVESQPCGTSGGRFKHWIPSGQRACVRCLTDLDTLTAELPNELETP